VTVRLEIGRLARPHGLKGEIMASLTTDQLDARCRPGAEWWAGSRRLVIESIRPHQHRWIVSFVGVSDRTASEALAGVVVAADAIEDPDALWVHDLVGSRVVDLSGTDHGQVTGVLANPAHPILELDQGGLVPTVFVVSSVDGVITIDPPDGLFEV
jgi:16S rRNA processing protein RimM